jgi:hypothetical protein
MKKLKSLFNPSINDVSWFDENYTLSIILEGIADTDGRECFTPAVKKGEELLVELTLDDAEYLFEELKHILKERARLKYESYRQMDKAYWRVECDMSDEEYDEREERLNSLK